MMFRNNLKIAFRSFSKRKLYGIINLLGLSVALAFCLLTFLYVNDEFSYDKFHRNGDRIYALYQTDFKTDNVQSDPGIWDTSIEPGITKSLSQNLPFLSLIEEKVPDIEHIIRSEFNGTTILKDGKSLQESVRYVDKEFLEVFSFNVLYGDKKNALNQPEKAVITEEIALKYFQRSDVVGESLRLGDSDFIISGVVERPRNSSISLNILLPFESSNYFKNNADNWGYSAAVGFVVLKEGVKPNDVTQKITDIYHERFPDRIKGLRLNLNLSEDNPVVEYNLINLQEMYLDPSIRFGKSSARLYSFIMIAVALVVLLIASVNYIAISVSSAGARSREVMVRKVVGASTKELKRQFHVESLLLTSLAMVLGYTLMQLLLPMFNELSGKSILMTPGLNQTVIAFTIILILIFGFVIGGYPAQILSRMRVNGALKGHGTHKIKPGLIKGMVVFQFSLCILFISMGLTMNRQFNYINDKDLGFDKDQMVYLSDAWGITERLKAELADEPSIAQVTGAGGFLAAGQSISTIVSNKVEYKVSRVSVDYDFFETLGIEFIEGRPFDPKLVTDKEGAMIVNKTFYSLINKDSSFNSLRKSIIGVVKDFHFESLSQEIRPMQFALGDQRYMSVLYAKLEANQVKKGLEALESAWDEVLPEQVMSLNFVDDYLANNYKDKKKWSKIINISSITAVLIACIGLFGLTAINVMNRTKEIGVRKVLGASLSSLLFLLNKQIFQLILLALVIALPLSNYLVTNWLDGFAYHIPVGYDLFAMAGILCLLVVILTIVYHSLKTSKINPSELLRDE